MSSGHRPSGGTCGQYKPTVSEGTVPAPGHPWPLSCCQFCSWPGPRPCFRALRPLPVTCLRGEGLSAFGCAAGGRCPCPLRPCEARAEARRLVRGRRQCVFGISGPGSAPPGHAALESHPTAPSLGHVQQKGAEQQLPRWLLAPGTRREGPRPGRRCGGSPAAVDRVSRGHTGP